MLLTLLQSQGVVPPVVESGPTPAGAVSKRRWAQIGKRMYHATDEEVRELLDSYVAGEEIQTPVESKPLKKKLKRISKAAAVEVPEAIEVRGLEPDYTRYKRLQDEYMAQMLLEAALRAQDEEDVEMLLH